MAWTREDTAASIMIFQHTVTSSGTSISSVSTTAGGNTGFIVQIDVAEGATDPGAWTLTLTDSLGVDMLDGQSAIPDNGILLTQADLGNGMAFVGPLTMAGSGLNNNSDIVLTVYCARFQ